MLISLAFSSQPGISFDQFVLALLESCEFINNFSNCGFVYIKPSLESVGQIFVNLDLFSNLHEFSTHLVLHKLQSFFIGMSNVRMFVMVVVEVVVIVVSQHLGLRVHFASKKADFNDSGVILTRRIRRFFRKLLDPVTSPVAPVSSRLLLLSVF
jgi:hypothetical protein